ncbi:TPR end-of-group domain-containing protein [Nitrospina gracilis]|uniref:TPR end-of-group domain-containing protein n=1 Tax=Nitrospina gracilis TaxID=35801 RepID=UPI001F233855|nr:tetratricopeptide repeat protein [Nitrospina gracilis]MCF8721028.1 tetratricopeptide (TPR) repeat protein [Nitrospina gracilis Nb-211]
MKIPPHIVQRYLPVLVVVFMGLALWSDQAPFNDPSPTENTAREGSATKTPGGAQPSGFSEGSKNQASDETRMAIHHYNEGNGFLSRGDWQEAVRNYKMALRHDKHLHPVYINLSSAYLKGQQFDAALETLNTLKEMEPDSPHLYYNLACYHALQNQTDEALTALKQSVQLGYKQFDAIRQDPDLASLRQTDAFKMWLNTLG